MHARGWGAYKGREQVILYFIAELSARMDLRVTQLAMLRWSCELLAKISLMKRISSQISKLDAEVRRIQPENLVFQERKKQKK